MCAVGNAVAGWPAPDWAQPWNAPFADVGSAVRAASEAGFRCPWR